MIIIGIIFLILFAFFEMCIVGSLANIQKEILKVNNRLDEIIRINKK